MSNPYVFVPEANVYQNAYYNQGQASPYGSPFVPNVNLQASPYANVASLPPSPHLGGSILPPGSLLFPGVPGGGDPVWDSAYRRPRQNSWHGPPQGLLTPGQPGHIRANSFGQANAPFFSPPPAQAGYYGQAPPASAPLYNTNFNPESHPPWYNRFLGLPAQREPEVHIHPWLNGESFRSDFLFNLSIPTFAPLRVVGPRGETALLGAEEMTQFATFPHIQKLTITCDIIPQFPIELIFNPANQYAVQNVAAIPPITVGDILMTLHRELHKPISQYDWGGLSTREEEEVTKAYLRRCRAAGPQMEPSLKAAGVKRVDFLKKDVMFRGLIRAGNGLEKMKMVVGPVG